MVIIQPTRMLMSLSLKSPATRTAFTLLLAWLAMTLSLNTFTLVHAQDAPNGSICVIAYSDLNRSQSRDPGEPLLKEVGVDVTFGENILIANHITDGSEPFCFQHLAFQKYSVHFKSQDYEATTPGGIEVTLSADNPKADVQFGGVAKATPTPDLSAQKPILNIKLTTPLRLGLSALGALLVMGFFLGLGLLIYGLFFRR